MSMERFARLGEYQVAVDASLALLDMDRVLPRIWARDHTVWKLEPTEAANRLGWLDIAARMEEAVPRLTAFAAEVRAAGLTEVLLLGMGGSSLAPDLFSRLPLPGLAGLPLAVLDSTDPEAVLAQAERLDPARTLFIVATKSGSTVETLSFFKFFYNWTMEALGAEAAGRHFVAITDPGSNLEALAARYGFRAVFLNDPNIGGRYSALSHFGLLPAALLGLDLNRLLARAQAMTAACGPQVAVEENPAAWLGAVLGMMALSGRDKATFFTAPALANFGDWVEQLLAESTGKKRRGIVPVVGEPLGPPNVYGSDRLFLSLALDDEPPALPLPSLHLALDDLYDLGGQFFLWELATAVAGHILGVNPFDQPDVEAAKELARQAVAAYAQSGRLPADEPAPLSAAVLHDFLDPPWPGDYIALQAYLPPTAEIDAALQTLRLRLRDRYRLATTVGYGPRFLHSTGQLHKGGRNAGLFIQLTADSRRDVPIPDEAGAPEATMTFGLLKMAQALGDKKALKAANRRVIRFHLGDDAPGGLHRLAAL